MSPVNDPGGRRNPTLITPPGSNPAIGQSGNHLTPRGITPLSYSPQQLGPSDLPSNGLLSQGDPGRGPGFALADHIHPGVPQSQSARLYILSETQFTFPLVGNGVLQFMFPLGATPQIDTLGSWTNDFEGGYYTVQVPGDYIVDLYAQFSLVSGSSNGPYSLGLTTFPAVGGGEQFSFDEYLIADTTVNPPIITLEGAGLLMGLTTGTRMRFAVGGRLNNPSGTGNMNSCLVRMRSLPT